MLREVMRHYGKTLLYYQCAENIAPPVEIMNELIPVLPRYRTQVANPSPLRSKMKDAPLPPVIPLIERPSENAPGNSAPLYYLTKRQLSEPKQVVTTRVIVVGGSLSAYAVLETLLFIPYLQLPHVYLVMENPPASIVPQKNKHVSKSGNNTDYTGGLSIVDAGEPIDQMMKACGYNNHVTVIKGKLTDIDRQNKAIIISDETVVEYDLLVLSCEMQDLSYKEFPETHVMHPFRAAEKGVFGIGNTFLDKAALKWIQKNYNKNPAAGVIIYGNSVEAWNAVGRLILLDLIDKSRINWILPDMDLPELGDDLVNNSLF